MSNLPNDLTPCPECREPEDLYHNNGDDGQYWVECICGHEGPYVTAPDEETGKDRAAIAWNEAAATDGGPEGDIEC